MRVSLDPDKDACVAFYEAMVNIGEVRGHRRRAGTSTSSPTSTPPPWAALPDASRTTACGASSPPTLRSTTTDMPYIELKNLSFSYPGATGAVSALEDVSLGIERGEFVSVVGQVRLRQEHAAAPAGRAGSALVRQHKRRRGEPRPRPREHDSLPGRRPFPPGRPCAATSSSPCARPTAAWAGPRPKSAPARI